MRESSNTRRSMTGLALVAAALMVMSAVPVYGEGACGAEKKACGQAKVTACARGEKAKGASDCKGDAIKAGCDAEKEAACEKESRPRRRFFRRR